MRGRGAHRPGLAGARLHRARLASRAVHPAHRPVTRQLVAAGLAQHGASSGWLLVPVDIDAGELRGRVVFLLGLAASYAVTFALVRTASTTGACAGPRPGIAAIPGRTPACRTRPRASASRSGRSSSRSFACSASCRRRSTATPRYRVVVERPLLALALPAGRGARRAPVALVGQLQQGRIAVYLLYSFVDAGRCSPGADAMSVLGSLSHSCSRSSSRCCSRRCSSAGSTSGAPGCRTSPRAGLLQPYRMLHKLFNKESVVAEHASPLFRAAPYIVFGCMLLRQRDHPDAVDRPAASLRRPMRSRWSACSRSRACSSRSRRWTSAPPSARWARGARC